MYHIGMYDDEVGVCSDLEEILKGIMEKLQMNLFPLLPTKLTRLSQLMKTSSSLTTLIGYLDAVHRGSVIGKERDDYIEIARRKSHDLKEYIDVPEQPLRARLDSDCYMRILNNLIQNVIAHSHADKIDITLSKEKGAI